MLIVPPSLFSPASKYGAADHVGEAVLFMAALATSVLVLICGFIYMDWKQSRQTVEWAATCSEQGGTQRRMPTRYYSKGKWHASSQVMCIYRQSGETQ